MSPPRLVAQRDLRNHTAEVLREVEAGTTVRITVNGRPVADLTPIRDRARFVGPDVLDHLFTLPGDDGWPALRDELRRDEPADPWQP